MTQFEIEFDEKIFNYSNFDTMLFCTKVQMERKFGVLDKKNFHIKIEEVKPEFGLIWSEVIE